MPRRAPITAITDHRPWALPRSPWVMAMTWRRLLFAHYRIDPEALRPLVPPRLTIDTWDGDAWIAVVPFTMTGVRSRGAPALPRLGAFHELNVRTYVTDLGGEDARPGVWFLSLDAANPLAVEVARRTFRLNYLHARMELREEGEATAYSSRRTDRRVPPAQLGAELDATYAPVEPLRPAHEGLEHWLIERYCLYSGGRTVYRADIHHEPWGIARAEWTVRANTMLAGLTGALLDARPLLHYAERIDTVAWLPRRLPALDGRTSTLPASAGVAAPGPAAGPAEAPLESSAVLGRGGSSREPP